jgi:hypothetical protein
MISYQDLDLRIVADGDGFTVSARRQGQCETEPFELDLAATWDLGKLERRGADYARTMGAALFDAIIKGRVRNLYHQARGSATSATGTGLRIRIAIDPRDERLRPLLSLPWELLFDRGADAGNLVALDPRRPIVRGIDSNEPSLQTASGPLRRVLLAASNPRDWEPLALDAECAAACTALERVGVRPRVLRHATRVALLDRIGDDEPQIVHFMGHGTFHPSSGEAVLVLEDDTAAADLLPASTFASFFVGRSAPRVLVLACCHSAELSPRAALGPFASLAAHLVATGLPAVIAMQTAVGDRSAVRFTDCLYRRLAQGDPVEAAVSHGRVALRAEHSATLDWAVPVLYLRNKAGGEEAVTTPPLSSALPEPPTQSIVVVHGNVGVQIVGDVGTVLQGRDE